MFFYRGFLSCFSLSPCQAFFMFFTNSIIIKVERQMCRNNPTVSAKGIGKPVPFALPVGGNRMEVKGNMSTQMDKLKAAQEKTLQKLHKAQEEEKQIRKRMREPWLNQKKELMKTHAYGTMILYCKRGLFHTEGGFTT